MSSSIKLSIISILISLFSYIAAFLALGINAKIQAMIPVLCLLLLIFGLTKFNKFARYGGAAYLAFGIIGFIYFLYAGTFSTKSISEFLVFLPMYITAISNMVTFYYLLLSKSFAREYHEKEFKLDQKTYVLIVILAILSLVLPFGGDINKAIKNSTDSSSSNSSNQDPKNKVSNLNAPKGTIETLLSEIAIEVNKKTPVVIDDNLTLIQMTSEGKKLFYEYEFGSNFQDIEPSKFHKWSIESAKGEICNDKFLVEMISKGASVNNRYYSKDKQLLESVNLNETCLK